MGKSSSASIVALVQEPELREVLIYWSSLEAGTPVPHRDVFSPAALTHMLPFLALVETAEILECFRVRLFGTALVQEFGEERTGALFRDLVRIEKRAEVLAPYQYVRDARRPHYQPLRSVSGDRPYRRYARLLVPLRGAGSAVSQIIAAFHFEYAAEFDGDRAAVDRFEGLSPFPVPTHLV